MTATSNHQGPGTMTNPVIRVHPGLCAAFVVTTAPTSTNPRALRITQHCS